MDAASKNSTITAAEGLLRALKRRGIESDLRIGVRKEANGFEAHAWVEHEGLVLLDPLGSSHRFTPFDEPIPARRP